MACSSHLVLHQTTIVPISKDGTSVSETEQIIKPYRDSMSKMMNIHVGNSPVNFIMERPSSNLMNWVADALFVNQTKTIRLTQPVFCLLNFGGIRSTLNKGEILMGDMFKLMPFDNLITWVEVPVEVLPEIATLLLKTGGEPLSCLLGKWPTTRQRTKPKPYTCMDYHLRLLSKWRRQHALF